MSYWASITSCAYTFGDCLLSCRRSLLRLQSAVLTCQSLSCSIDTALAVLS